MKEILRKYINDLITIVLILIISLIHYYTNSIGTPYHNFYRLLYIIPIIITSFRFGFKGSLMICTIVSLIYSPHILLSVNIETQTISEALDIILFFAVGITIGTIVERRQLETIKIKKELKKYMILEEYTNSIIESIKSGVLTVNNDMLITIINQGAKEILGLDGNYIGISLTEVFKCCENMKYKIEEAISNNSSIENIEMTFDRPGKEVYIRVNIYPLNLENMKKGLVIIIDDISEIKRIQQHLIRNDKLIALGEISSGIAHEIRNPLAIIKVIGQTLKKSTNNDDAIKELEIIDAEVERANRIVKMLMEFAKPSKDKLEFKSINDVVKEVLAIVDKYAVQHGVKIDYKKNKTDYFEYDKELIKQAFVNIIFNAVQAMQGGGRLEIITKNYNDSWVQVIFKDNGCGIEKENIEKVFNPFFTTKHDGTGLGLSIVHRIIEEHNGIINVESELNKGTVFEILFPTKKEVE